VELGTVIVDHGSDVLIPGGGKSLNGLLGFDGPELAAENALEIQRQSLGGRFHLSTGGLDLLLTEAHLVVGTDNLGRDRIADLFGRESRLDLLTGSLALKCSVAEAETLQFPDHQGVEIGPPAEVTKEGVRPSAEPTGT
jgi:hypothetical protein